MTNVNDIYKLHSENGMDYKIRIVSVNNFRPPETKYGADVWDGNGVYAGDVQFFGEELLEKCEFIGKE